jgi:cytochrome P450 family 6
MSLVLALFLSLIALFYFWKKKHFNFWTKNGFLQADGSFPLGSLGGVGTKMCSTEKYDSLYREFKGRAPLVGFYNFLSPAILPLDPDLIKDMLVRDFASFHDRGLFYNKEDDPVSAK